MSGRASGRLEKVKIRLTQFNFNWNYLFELSLAKNPMLFMKLCLVIWTVCVGKVGNPVERLFTCLTISTCVVVTVSWHSQTNNNQNRIKTTQGFFPCVILLEFSQKRHSFSNQTIFSNDFIKSVITRSQLTVQSSIIPTYRPLYDVGLARSQSWTFAGTEQNLILYSFIFGPNFQPQLSGLTFPFTHCKHLQECFILLCWKVILFLYSLKS